MNADTITAICGGFVALLALGVSIYQSYIGRQHNRLSVTPHLDFEVSYGAPGHPYGVYIMNNGIGPAELEKLSPLCGGTPYTADYHPWLGVWQQAGFPTEHAVFHYFTVGDFLPAGRKFPLLTLADEAKAGELTPALREALEKVDLSVTYTCVYRYHSRVVALSDADVRGPRRRA